MFVTLFLRLYFQNVNNIFPISLPSKNKFAKADLLISFHFREDGFWAKMAITLSPVSSSGQKRWPSPPRSWHNRSSNMHDSWKWLCNPPPGTHLTMYRCTQTHAVDPVYIQSAQMLFPWGIWLRYLLLIPYKSMNIYFSCILKPVCRSCCVVVFFHFKRWGTNRWTVWATAIYLPFY